MNGKQINNLVRSRAEISVSSLPSSEIRLLFDLRLNKWQLLLTFSLHWANVLHLTKGQLSCNAYHRSKTQKPWATFQKKSTLPAVLLQMCHSLLANTRAPCAHEQDLQRTKEKKKKLIDGFLVFVWCRSLQLTLANFPSSEKWTRVCGCDKACPGLGCKRGLPLIPLKFKSNYIVCLFI